MLSFHATIGIAVIGYALGVAVASRFAQHDRKAPAAAGVVGAVLFYLAAEFLVLATIVVLIVLTLWLAIRAWPTVHESMLTFARHSGVRIGALRTGPSVADRIGALHQEYASRVASIRELGLPEDDEGDCVESASGTLRNAVMHLAATPYTPDEA